MPTYDYIIIGAGASGMLLADSLAKDPFFASKSILLLEKEAKNKNDRTWCFWERGKGQFDEILFKSWPKVHVAAENLNIKPDIAPYTYKMLRGIDFYEFFITR